LVKEISQIMALYTSTLYPFFARLVLREQRGKRWSQLVDTISELPATDTRVMAFSLTMRRLRAYRNAEHQHCRDTFCAVCASQVVANFDGSEQELMDFYRHNLDEVNMALKTMRRREMVPVAEEFVA
jgi:hypothetical protein